MYIICIPYFTISDFICILLPGQPLAPNIAGDFGNYDEKD